MLKEDGKNLFFIRASSTETTHKKHSFKANILTDFFYEIEFPLAKRQKNWIKIAKNTARVNENLDF